MTWQEAVEIVVTRTGHGRYEWLCSDANPDAGSREGYRRLVLRMAGEPVNPGGAPPEIHAGRIPLRDSIRLVRLGLRACFYSTHDGCGCTGAYCHWHGRIVGPDDCLPCLDGK